jgi:hypothetical protein
MHFGRIRSGPGLIAGADEHGAVLALGEFLGGFFHRFVHLEDADELGDHQ